MDGDLCSSRGRALVRTAQTPPLSNKREQWSTANFAWLPQPKSTPSYLATRLTRDPSFLLPYSSEYLYRCEWVWSSVKSQYGRCMREETYTKCGGGRCLPPLPPYSTSYTFGVLCYSQKGMQWKSTEHNIKSLPVEKMLDSVTMWLDWKQEWVTCKCKLLWTCNQCQIKAD